MSVGMACVGLVSGGKDSDTGWERRWAGRESGTEVRAAFEVS